MQTLNWVQEPTRYLFFTGKGGVGKTSLACAIAVNLADRGKKVLLVSTDPASNLADVFGVEVGSDPAAIPQAPGLFALNIDPEAAAEAYRERVLGPVRGVLPEQALRSMEEQLSGACTTEIAAFDEFTGILTSPERTASFDHVVFDTAPTGHTLRLLQLPAAWTGFLDSNQSGTSCLGPLSGLENQRKQYAQAVEALCHPATTTLALVSRAQAAALEEADRTSLELEELGVKNQRLLLNAMMPPDVGEDPLARSILAREKRALEGIPAHLSSLPRDDFFLKAYNMVGIQALRSMFNGDDPEKAGQEDSPGKSTESLAGLPSVSTLLQELRGLDKGVIMLMGKGGVGKTTLAAAIAAELASTGHKVHLTTTDPAAHVARTLEQSMDNLEVSRIDPEEETEKYRNYILETKGRDLDPESLALLKEDLRSPCTEEIAVFQAFSRILKQAEDRIVVVDTAPTGHTLLLLDATGAYHREMLRHHSGEEDLLTPLMRLQDPDWTKVLVTTLPETTPVLEAEHLQKDLRRAGIEPWAWVVNASLRAAGTSSPFLQRRARAEARELEKIQNGLSRRAGIVPFAPDEPVGPEKLLGLVRQEV